MPAFKLFPIYFLITSLWEFQNWMNMCYRQFSAGQKYQLLNERSNVMNRFEKWCLNHFMKMGKRESSPGGKVTTGVIYECYNGDPAQLSITEQKQKACWTGMSLIASKAINWPLCERKQETCSYYASYFIINVDIYIFSPKWITNTSCEFFLQVGQKQLNRLLI